MTRQVGTSPGGAYDLGYHVMWCPKCRRPASVAKQVKGLTSYHLRAAFPHVRSQLPALWSRSCFVATVGAVSAATMQRYLETRYERSSKGGGRA